MNTTYPLVFWVLAILIGTGLGHLLSIGVAKIARRVTAPARERRRQAGEASYVLAKALGHSVMFDAERPPLDQLAHEAADRLGHSAPTPARSEH